MMIANVRPYRDGLIVLLLVAGSAIVPGCRDDSDKPNIMPLEGRVESIDVRPDGTGTITILYFSEKHNQEITGIGEVTKLTEIMINGAVATLRDIREGDQVRGEVRVEKRDRQKKQIALKIHVDRAIPIGRDE